MFKVIQSFFFIILILLFTTKSNSETIKNLAYEKDFIKIDLEVSDRDKYIFFETLGDENHSIQRALDLRAYLPGKIKINNSNFIDVNFRSRGLVGDHYNNKNRSIKIKVKPTKAYKKNDRVINLNSIISDTTLKDAIIYSVFKKYDFLAPEINLAVLSINKEINGIKLLQENLDDTLLKKNGIKLGSMYREAYSGALDSYRGWLKEDYSAIWEIQSLKRQKDMDDWINFISSNSTQNKKNFKLYLEKNLDIEKYLKFLALNMILGGHWHTSDHNLVFVNNFEKQKFQPVSYDPGGLTNFHINSSILFFNNNFNAKIFTYNEYWNKYIDYLYFFLIDPNFDKFINEGIDSYYLKLKKATNYLINEKGMNINDILSSTTISALNLTHKDLIKEKDFNKGSAAPLLKAFGCTNEIKLPYVKYDLDCVIRLYKSDKKKHILERKKSILNEIQHIEHHMNLYQVMSDKNFFDVSLKIKSLSNFKINNLVFKINDNNINNYKNSYLCLNSNYKQEVKKNCILGEVENKFIIFNLKNKNVIIKSNIFKNHKINNNRAAEITVDPHIENNYRSVEKLFLLYLDAKKNIFSATNLKVSSISVSNLTTGKETELKKNIKNKILLDNFDIVAGPYEVKDIPIYLSSNKNINNLYKIKVLEKPKWVSIGKKNNIIFKVPNNKIGIHDLKFEIIYNGKVVQKYNRKIDVQNWTFPSNFLARYSNKLSKYLERGQLREDMYSRVIYDLRNLSFDLKNKLDNIFNFNSFFTKKGYTIDQSFFKKIYLPKNQEIVWGPNKTIFIEENTILPVSSSLIIKPGTKVLIRKKKGIIFNGLVKANGVFDNPIIFTSKSKKEHFGALIFNHNSVNGSNLKNVQVRRGKHMFWEGRFYIGALNVYNSSINIENSIFSSNLGDDAINFKYSKSKVKNSKFLRNNFDAIDADFSHITIENSFFEDNGNDAIDLGTSIGLINNNEIIASGDKGISLGEESFAFVENNIFKKNKLGIANKDESYLQIRNNTFINNENKIKQYIKKNKFNLPKTVNLNN